MARSRRTPAMLVGRCSSKLSSHKTQAKFIKSQAPSAAEGSAVFSVPSACEEVRLVQQRGFDHAATGYQARQMSGELVSRRRCLLHLSVLLRAKEKELQFACCCQIETLAHEHLSPLAHNQHRPFTCVVDLFGRS